MKKKFFIYVLILTFMTSIMTSCTRKNQTIQTNNSNKNINKQKVNFWYLWGGDEAKIIEKIIKAYNESQDKYEVVGMSTPDIQKIITAISGGQGPDVTDNFGGNVPNYALQNIAMPLNELIEKDKFDTSIFVDSALQHQKFNDKIYALPLSINVTALYYNKDLLKNAGINELPKNLEELMEMMEKTTKIENGNVEQIGFPFTNSFWIYAFTYAYGDKFGTTDGSLLTPDNEGFKKVLEFTKKQVDKFGKDVLNSYISSSKAKNYTPQDAFLQGKQAFRIDGPWFYKMAQDAKINFGVMPVPGSIKMGNDGYSMLDTSMMFIPTTSKCKEGAWDFIKYITAGEGSKIFITEKGDLPPTKSMVNDPQIIGISDLYKVYLDIISKNNCYTLPQFENTSQYEDAIKAAIEDVLLGDNVNNALIKLQKQTVSIKK